MQLEVRTGARAWVVRTLVAAMAAAMVMALGTPVSAQLPEFPVEVPLVPVDGSPLDDFLPVDGDLIDVPFTNTISLTGQTPVEAAVALSQATFESADAVLLARSDLFADAMAASGLQGVLNAPLLLTDGTALDVRLVNELVRLQPQTIYLLGGTEALRPGVESALRALGYQTERIAGQTRVETAIAVAERFMPQATDALVVRAYPSPALADPTQAYADLLAVGGLAADEQLPVFLTQTDVLTTSLQAHLAGAAVRQSRIIGGTAAISDVIPQTLQGMGIGSQRIAGLTRAGTAIAVAAERGFDSSADTNRIILAEGAREHTWAPGFAAAAHSAQYDAPIVLALGPVLAPETLAFLATGVVDNLMGESPTLVCAPFVDPLACSQAALALGQLPAVLDPVLGLLTDVLALGDELLGQVTGATGMSVSLCGLPAEDVALDEEGRFAVPLSVTTLAPLVGEVCDLDFRVTDANGRVHEGSLPATLELPDLLDPDLELPELPDAELPDAEL
jgi:putative cell wall-binding protein